MDVLETTQLLNASSVEQMNDFSVEFGWDAVYTQLATGDSDWGYQEGVCETILTTREGFSAPLSLKSSGYPGCFTLAVFTSSAPASINGMDVQADNFLMAMPGADIELVTQGPGDLIITLIPETEIETNLADSFRTLEKSLESTRVCCGDTGAQTRAFTHWFQNWSSTQTDQNEIDRTAVTRQLHETVYSSLHHIVENQACPTGKPKTGFTPGLIRIKDLIDYFHAYPTEAISLEEMTQFTRTSPRSLYYNFKKYTGYTPQQYFKLIRLGYLRRELAGDIQSLTTLAYKFNFFHLGDFAALYKRVYGELPSDTRRNIFMPDTPIFQQAVGHATSVK